MNQRIQALLLRLAEDEELRARFVKDGRGVMNEAGLEPTERAEFVRHVDERGNPNAASIVPGEEAANMSDGARSGPVATGPRY